MSVCFTYWATLLVPGTAISSEQQNAPMSRHGTEPSKPVRKERGWEKLPFVPECLCQNRQHLIEPGSKSSFRNIFWRTSKIFKELYMHSLFSTPCSTHGHRQKSQGLPLCPSTDCLLPQNFSLGHFLPLPLPISQVMQISYLDLLSYLMEMGSVPLIIEHFRLMLHACLLGRTFKIQRNIFLSK